jgi:hypothetical protein
MREVSGATSWRPLAACPRGYSPRGGEEALGRERLRALLQEGDSPASRGRGSIEGDAEQYEEEIPSDSDGDPNSFADASSSKPNILRPNILSLLGFFVVISLQQRWTCPAILPFLVVISLQQGWTAGPALLFLWSYLCSSAGPLDLPCFSRGHISAAASSAGPTLPLLGFLVVTSLQQRWTCPAIPATARRRREGKQPPTPWYYLCNVSL